MNSVNATEIYFAIFAASIALLGTLLIVIGFIQTYIVKMPQIFESKFVIELEKKKINALFNSIYLTSISFILLSLFELVCVAFELKCSIYILISSLIFSILLIAYFFIFLRIKKLL